MTPLILTQLLAAALSPAPQGPPAAEGAPVTRTAEAPRFASPVRLHADGAALATDVLYPSPRMVDIDLDGKAELVVGDLPGRVLVAERAEGDDPAAFAAGLVPFRTGERALKFNNW